MRAREEADLIADAGAAESPHAAATDTDVSNSVYTVQPPLFSQTNVRKPEYWQFAKLIAPAPQLPEGKKLWTTDDAVGIWCLKCSRALNYHKGSSQSIRYHMETKHMDELQAFRQQQLHQASDKHEKHREDEKTRKTTGNTGSTAGVKRESSCNSNSGSNPHSPLESDIRTKAEGTHVEGDEITIPSPSLGIELTAKSGASLPLNKKPRTENTDSWSKNLERRGGFFGNPYWYDLHLHRRLPLAEPMVEELIAALPPCDGKHVVDLCAGSGFASLPLLKAYPTATVTLMDASEERLMIAKKRFANAHLEDNVQFVTRRFIPEEMTAVSSEPVDVVIACLALHVLAEKPAHYNHPKSSETSHERREEVQAYSKVEIYEQIFRAIYNSLAPGGHIIIGDHVGQLGLFEQLQVMAKVGFIDVDCSWRQADFFVAGGRKPYSSE